MARKQTHTAGAVVASALPPLEINAARRFPNRWEALPTHAKLLHALAGAAGLTVNHTDAPEIPPEFRDQHGPAFVWMGERERFEACGLFKLSTNWHFVGWHKTTTGEGLCVDLLRVPGRERGEPEIMVAVHTGYAPVGPRSCARFAALADSDQAFRAFRLRVLEPIAGLALDASDGQRDPSVTIPLWFSENIARDYRSRGVFAELLRAAKPWGRDRHSAKISEQTARAILADAAQQIEKDRSRPNAQKWHMLRKRIHYELARADTKASAKGQRGAYGC